MHQTRVLLRISVSCKSYRQRRRVARGQAILSQNSGSAND
eukprot:UN09058